MIALANPDLRWERTTGINLGFDAEFLKGRLSATLDFYQSTTRDLLYDLVLPQVTGFGIIRTNIGQVSNRGVELILNGAVVETEDLTWNLGFNIDANMNRIDELLGVDRDNRRAGR